MCWSSSVRSLISSTGQMFQEDPQHTELRGWSPSLGLTTCAPICLCNISPFLAQTATDSFAYLLHLVISTSADFQILVCSVPHLRLFGTIYYLHFCDLVNQVFWLKLQRRSRAPLASEDGHLSKWWSWVGNPAWMSCWAVGSSGAFPFSPV